MLFFAEGCDDRATHRMKIVATAIGTADDE
jgi:hypothetical protein